MRGSGVGARIMRIAAVVIVLVALVLALAQVLLPAIASSTISSRIGRYGKVSSVTIKAFPAVKLLWSDADSVKVVAKDLVMTPEQTVALVREAKGAAKLDARAVSVKEGPLRLTAVRLQKRGDRVFAAGTMSAAAVAEALPAGVRVKLLESGEGEVRVRVSGGLFGVGASVEAVAFAERGSLVARPTARALRGLRLTLFADPHFQVEGVGASPAAKPATSYRLSIRGRLR